MDPAQFLRSAAVLVVADVLASVAFYRDKLGFRQVNLWGDPPCFAIVVRGTVSLFLDQTRKPIAAPVNQYWAAYIYVDNVEALHAEYSRCAVEVIRGLETTDYGCREFDVRDLDGHIIGFGQDLQPMPQRPGL